MRFERAVLMGQVEHDLPLSGNQREGNKEGPSRHWACPHTHAHNCILTGRLMSTALSYGHRLDE